MNQVSDIQHLDIDFRVPSFCRDSCDRWCYCFAEVHRSGEAIAMATTTLQLEWPTNEGASE